MAISREEMSFILKSESWNAAIVNLLGVPRKAFFPFLGLYNSSFFGVCWLLAWLPSLSVAVAFGFSLLYSDDDLARFLFQVGFNEADQFSYS